jgi:HEAT repeat protein
MDVVKNPGSLALVAVAGLAAVLVAGCVSGSGGSMGSRAGIESANFDAKDPVIISGIRERAISLIGESANSTDARIRTNAVEAASLAPERLQPVIARALDDRNAGVRTVAAMAVGKASLAKLAGRVRPLLMDDSPYVRSAAIYALARCGAEVDRTPLASMLLSDPSIRVRSHVAFILGELGDQSAVPLLHESVREHPTGITPDQFKLFELQAAEAMIKLGEDAQRTVVRASLYPSTPDELEATALAVQIIGEVQDKEAAAQLVSLANYRTPVPPVAPGAPVKEGKPYPAEVRLAVAGAMSAMGFKGGGNAIADEFVQSETPAIRAQSAFVYGQIGGTENWGKLDALMGDPDGTVRVSAAAAVLRSTLRPPG